MTETVGQREDAEAFAEWLLTLIGFGMYPDRRLARAAFDAGMKRGEEKRGCCVRGRVREAKPRPFEEG